MDYLVKLKNCGVAEVVLLHVADIKIISETDVMFEEEIDEKAVIDQCRQTAEKKLQSLARELEEAGLKVRTAFRVGVPFAEIIHAAEEEAVSLIVMGHRGHNLAEELLLGSTAEKVARKSKRPVLLIR